MILLVTAMLFGGIILRTYINYGLTLMELISAFVGLGFMTAAYNSDFTLIGKYPKTVANSILALSIFVLIISPIVNGRAYYAGFMPLLFPLGFAAILYVTRDKGYLGIILCGISFLLPAFFVACTEHIRLRTLQRCRTHNFKHRNCEKMVQDNRLFGCLLVYIPAAITLLFAVMSSWKRLRIALNPSIDPAGGGWFGTVIRSLLDGSKLFGRGNMPAEHAMLVFPLPKDSIDTDFLLTCLIFKFGWITFVVIMSVLLFFIIKGFMLCFKQKSCLGLVVSVSFMLIFTMQVFGYVIANLGFLFTTPISLPLISYGKVAAIINLTLVGIMLSVFRTGEIVKDKNSNIIRNDNFITWSDGKLIISFGKK